MRGDRDVATSHEKPKENHLEFTVILNQPRFLEFTGHNLAIVVFVLIAFVASKADADSSFYKPASDDEIVAQLPSDIVALATRLHASENNIAGRNASTLEQQTRQILDSYRIASGTNSARAYGHTLALLDAWPNQAELPSMLRLIRADVLQHNHEFDKAISDLNVILSQDSSNRFALQMKSQVQLVTGKYESVASACASLESAGHGIAAYNCQAQLDGASGNAAPALLRVESLLQNRVTTRGDALELTITAAGLAQRLGRHHSTERYYSNALRLSPGNDYVLVNYAEWLLEQNRAADAASLLLEDSGNANKFEMQLIYMQALQLSGGEQSNPELLSEIRNTAAIMDSRSEERPSKLLARYCLSLSQDFACAHREALQNWQVQKESSDSWLLARAAVAAERWDSLSKLRQWYASTEQQDYRVEQLLAQYEGAK